MKRQGVLWAMMSSVALLAADVPALTIHFDRENGAIKKSLHGSGCLPSIGGSDRDEDFRAMHFSYCRTHDQALCNSGQRVVDTHFVFPLENADAADPKNYYFTATDFLLNAAVRNGSLPYYRFGTSIEGVAQKTHFNTYPPKDAGQYAKILAGIIRHYNYGWANGFHMGIPYWEIWNEPNMGPVMWMGTKAEFVRFFATVLQHLKTEFPNEKIGGPGLSWPDPEWMNPLLAECRKRGVKPDFFSFHCYESRPEVFAQLVKECRAILNAADCGEVEIHLNEWHYIRGRWAELEAEKSDGDYYELMNGTTGMWGIDSAAFNVAVFTLFHDVPVDVACYYGLGRSGDCNCWGHLWGFYTHGRKRNKNFYSMKMIGEFVTDYSVRVQCESARPGFYALAALNPEKNRGAILIGDYRSNQRIAKIRLDGLKGIANLRIVRLDQTHDEKEIPAEWQDGTLTLSKDNINSAVWLIRFDIAEKEPSSAENPRTTEAEKPAQMEFLK